MEYTRGREHAKRNIVLFIVGVFITFIGAVLTNISDVVGVDWLAFFGFLALVGGILEIIAIICLRNVNKKYANALWALILYFLLNFVSIILIFIAAFSNNPDQFDVASSWILIASDFAEALIVINFVMGTNLLAEEDDLGMPRLTKTVVFGYLGLFLVGVIFDALSLIPAIRENTIVLLVFVIIVSVLYVVRTVGFFVFSVKALFRVK